VLPSEPSALRGQAAYRFAREYHLKIHYLLLTGL
jgi:hypothetical protein